MLALRLTCPRPVCFAVLPALLLFVATGCSQSATQAVENTGPNAKADADPAKAGGPPAGPPPALVKVAVAKRESVAPVFRAMGNVRPRYFSIVASGADGVVAEFPVEVGEFVKSGTLLSQLRMEATDLDLGEQQAVLAEREAEVREIQSPRTEDVEEAKARLQAAEVTHQTAERRLKELRELGVRGAATSSTVKDAEDEFDAAQQNLLAARAVYQKVSSGAREEQKQQAAARLEAQRKHVDFLKAEREKRFTKAPFDGFLVQEHTYVGQWLAKGAPVVTLSKLDEVEVEVQIDQQYIDQIRPGQSVSLKIAGSGSQDGTDREWTGEVGAIVPRTNWEDGSRSFPVIVRIKNEIDRSVSPPTPALREGMMAEAEFSGRSLDALLVPKDALVRTSRGTFLFAVNPSNGGTPPSVRQIIVQPGIGTGTWIQVTPVPVPPAAAVAASPSAGGKPNGGVPAVEDGLEAGDQVVTEGAERLRAFATIAITE